MVFSSLQQKVSLSFSLSSDDKIIVEKEKLSYMFLYFIEEVKTI